jgi:polyvinyl alcohol dehydrogenase (cytochrome)
MGALYGRRFTALAVVAMLLTGSAVAAAPPAAREGPPSETREFVLSPEGNHLWVYDPVSGERQLLVQAVNGGDPGVAPPQGSEPRDINGQICVSPDGRHFVAGEDTVFSANGGASSHDARIAGWAWYEISGAELGDITAQQVGKLSPEFGDGPGYVGDPDNYGCGFLDDDRVLTTGIGDPFPHEQANGQLFLWFGPFDAGYSEATLENGAGYLLGEVPHCQLDDTLATAGGIAVDEGGDVYVAANRPDGSLSPGGVWRFSGTFPTSHAECTEEFIGANITKELVIPIVPVGVNPLTPTPSAVAISPQDTLYVSSVFTGKVSEYTKDGQFLRDVYPLAPVAASTGAVTGDTPFGIAFDGAGDLWIADLGIVGVGPQAGAGSLIRVRMDDGDPRPFGETIQDGLTFPDGLGIYSPGRHGHRPPQVSSSEWGCGHWGMYGRTVTRQFSSDCPSPISADTVATLRPTWTFRVPFDVDDQSTFTATPAIVDDVVYAGAWNGVMYALDAADGTIVWETSTQDAPGALYGPIVSSPAVADVVMSGGGPAAETRRLVIFGAGPVLYALDAADGGKVWTLDISAGLEGTRAQIESSPVVYDGVVYVGRDVHNRPGDVVAGVRGGMMAVDAATGQLEWFYNSEERLGLPPSGCGGVWGSPALDVDAGLLYFGTANCPQVANPDLPMEEITALRMATGEWVWTFWPHEPPDLDEDFGATPNLYVDADGRQVLGAGNKDGFYYALDPATGELLWSTKVAEPAPNIGGFIGSPAVWQGNIFGGTAIGTAPFFHSIAGATGAVRWQSPAHGPTYGATVVVNGVVFSGGLDFMFKAFDADTGLPLWAVPMPGAVSSSAAVVGDLVVVGSGTSTSDACFKDNITDEACEFVFDTALGQQGGLHAFTLGPPVP